MNFADGVDAPSIAVQLAGSGLIGVREGLETGIVVMILVALLVKSDRRDSLKWVTVGVLAAVVLVAAIFFGIHYGTSTLSGLEAELIAGVASLIAVLIVTWMVLWMRTAARGISGELRADMTRALFVGPVAVVSLAFLSVGREGVETALLMVGYAENTAGSSWPLIGLLLGIAVAAMLTVFMYFGSLRINFATFFKYTGALLVVVAAGILAYGLRALQTVGWLPGLSNTAFDVSAHFELSSWYGAMLQGIFNFRPDPTVLQVVAWGLYVAIVLSVFLRPQSRPVAAHRSPGHLEPEHVHTEHHR
ncbi:iron uptake transporter permease EfeU [Mycolicibacterium chlorophenolicum]|uniref:Ferrous iron permease EfeU n=1 Tax=Mycolicibacterium chlorophenolicum TaxID=37916 RepID=A0A0J6VMS4_9MYCO|nr:iron uptake transporter permease EfeU [Mycolicibacterium chlorophenolicum]KMO70778.1 Ferrous iron permease EfeU [Mycolicibacterium chlorophenolicum]